MEIETDQEFLQLLEQAARETKLVFVKFGATWCGPCRKIAPYFGELAQQRKHEAYFVTMDVDQVPEVWETLRLRNIPAFCVFENGTVVSVWKGDSVPEMIQRVQNLLKQKQGSKK
jgi:thioredoxin 1